MVKNHLRILKIKMTEQGLEEKFESALERWREHCRRNSDHSDAQSYLDSDAYREIVSMGVEVLPFIREAYANESEDVGEPGRLWAYVIHEIVGDDFRSDVKGVKQFTLKWLDENIPKYTQAE